MEFVFVLRELWRRKRLVITGILIATLSATLSLYRLDGLKLHARSLQYSRANAQVLVDSPSSVLGNSKASLDPLTGHSFIYANLMASPAVLELVARQVGLRTDQIYATEPLDPRVPQAEQEPTPLKRTYEVAGESTPYRLTFTDELNLSTIGVSAQAPTTGQAIALANAAVAGLQRYVAHWQEVDALPAASRVEIREVGRASGGVVNAGIRKTLAALVFTGVFVLWCVLILVGSRLRDHWRASGALHEGRGEARQKLDHLRSASS